MPKYLIVAHQTAESAELRTEAKRLADSDPTADFTLLVPATPAGNLFVWEEAQTDKIAERRAMSAREVLMADGIKIIDARVGDPDPYNAVADELLREPGYTALCRRYPSSQRVPVVEDRPHQPSTTSRFRARNNPRRGDGPESSSPAGGRPLNPQSGLGIDPIGSSLANTRWPRPPGARAASP